MNQNRLLSQGFKIFETIKRYLAIASIRGINVESAPAFWTTIQSTLGFATMGIAANLGIATATPLTASCHYVIATLGITTPNFGPYVAK